MCENCTFSFNRKLHSDKGWPHHINNRLQNYTNRKYRAGTEIDISGIESSQTGMYKDGVLEMYLLTWRSTKLMDCSSWKEIHIILIIKQEKNENN